MTYKNNQILETNLNIDSRHLNKNIDSLILHNLKEKYENICTEHGFIIPNSIKLINRRLGNINTINNISYISYIIRYSADIIYPSEGDIIDIKVDRVNKMGVLGYIKVDDSGNLKDLPDKKDFDTSPLIVIVPKEYFNEDTRNIDDITRGQSLKVTIIGCRIKYGNKKIQIIASPI
tara:strand:- start:314 stop:841 length:528 start_codon:yes stop_codon:yes gene_type:complete